MKMLKNEWRFIGHNRLILLSVIVMTLIPLLYSVFFLKSVWDPYGETQALPVAVVNQDQPVKYNGETLNVGKQTVQKLKNNKQLGWRFVSAKQAKQGLKDKKYYTVITLPKNFSANATTALNKNPKKMQLSYKTNGSLNYIGEVISEIGATSLDKEIRAAVTNAYASAMFDQLHVVGKGMTTAAKGATQLDNGLVTLNDGLGQYTVAVSQVNDGVQTLKVSVKPLASGVQQLTTGSNQLASGIGAYTDGVGQLSGGISTLQSSVGPLASGVSQLANGGNTLNSGISTYTNYSSQINSGIKTLASSTADLPTGVAALYYINNNMANQLTALSKTLESTNVGDLSTQIKNTQTNLNDMSELLDQMDGLSKVDLNDSITQLKAMKQKFPEVASGLASATGAIDTNSGTAASDAEAILTDNETTLSSDAKAKLQDIVDKSNANSSYAEGIQQQVSGLQQQLDTASQDIGQLEGVLTELQQLQQRLPAIRTQVTDAQSLLQQSEGLLGTLNIADLQTMAGKLPAMRQSINDLVSAANQAATYSTALNNGVNGTGSVDLKDEQSVYSAAKNSTFTAGLNSLLSGSNQLNQQNGAINSGASQLASGLNTMNDQVPTLVSGVGQLYSGSQTLSANSGALNSGATQLATGLNTMNAQIPTLTAGVDQLADGTSQLNSKSAELMAGGNKLNDGSNTLATALTAGGKQVNGIQTTAKTADMFASPTKLTHKDYSYVPNYGHALAPYVLSLALYVGAIVFNFAYPIRRISTKDQSATAWFFSKVSVGGAVAIMMAVIEASLMLLFGLSVDHVGQFYLMAITFALASMFLVMLLSMAFDNPGRFVAMVLLMLQLGGSGGTFPMEVTNSFYNAIHPYLPMTYSILGFRQAITSGLGNGQTWSAFATLAGILVVSLLLLWWIMQILQRIHLNGVSQLDENQKLQKLEQ